MSFLKINRPRARLIRQLINLFVMAAVAAYLLISYQSSGWTYDIVAGTIFAVWSGYVLWHILSRSVVFEEVEDGFKVHQFFWFRHIKWDDLVAIADGDGLKRIVFLAYRKPGEQKDRYIGISRRLLSDENVGDVLALIRRKRPDLRRFADGKVQDDVAQIDLPRAD